MASGKNIRLGGAFIEIGAVDDKLRAALDGAAKRLRSFASLVSGIGAGLAGFSLVPLGGLFALGSATAAAGDDLANMAARTGLAVAEIAALSAMAEDAGGSMEGVEAATRKLQINLAALAEDAEDAGGKTKKAFDYFKDGADDAEESLSGVAKKFEQFGLKLSDFDGKSPYEQLLVVADAMARIEDPAQRAYLATQLLGKGGASLIPILSGGAKAVREYRARMDELGITAGALAAESVAPFDDLLASIGRQFTAIRQVVGAAAATTFTPYIRAAQPLIAAAIRFVVANQGVVRQTILTASAVAVLGGSLLALGGTLAIASFALSGFAPIVTLALAPIRLVTAAMFGAAGAAVAFGGAALRMVAALSIGARLAAAAAAMQAFAVAAFGVVSGAVATGFAAVAGAITAVAGAAVAGATAFAGAMVTIAGAALSAVGAIVSGLAAALPVIVSTLAAVPGAVAAVVATVAPTVAASVSVLIGVVTTAASIAVTSITGIVGAAATTAIAAISGTIAAVGTAISGAFLAAFSAVLPSIAVVVTAIGAIEAALASALLTGLFAIVPGVAAMVAGVIQTFGLLVPALAIIAAAAAAVMLAKLAAGMISGFGGAVGSMVDAAQSAFGRLGEMVVSALSSAYDAAVSVVGRIGRFFAGIGASIAAGFRGAAAIVAGVAGEVARFFGQIPSFAAAGFSALTTFGAAAASAIGKVFGDLRTILGDTFSAAMDALQAGDLALAGEAAMVGLQAAWQRGVLAIQTVWYAAKDSIVRYAAAAYGVIAERFVGVVNTMQIAWANGLTGLRAAWAIFSASVGNMWESVTSGVIDALLVVQSKVSGVSIDDLRKQAATDRGIRERRRADELQAGLTDISAQGQAQADALRKELESRIAAIRAAAADLPKGADEAGKANLAATEAKLKELEERLQAIKDFAQIQRDNKEDAAGFNTDPFEGLDQMLKKSQAAVGTFSAASAGFLFGKIKSPQDKVEDNTARTAVAAEKTASLLDALAKKKGPVFA